MLKIILNERKKRSKAYKNRRKRVRDSADAYGI